MALIAAAPIVGIGAVFALIYALGKANPAYQQLESTMKRDIAKDYGRAVARADCFPHTEVLSSPATYRFRCHVGFADGSGYDANARIVTYARQRTDYRIRDYFWDPPPGRAGEPRPRPSKTLAPGQLSPAAARALQDPRVREALRKAGVKAGR
jgi:hypothetical protein